MSSVASWQYLNTPAFCGEEMSSVASWQYLNTPAFCGEEVRSSIRVMMTISPKGTMLGWYTSYTIIHKFINFF
jgi:hypothetical protein